MDSAAEREPPVTPLMVPPEATPIVLYGGTFDPPHRAHLELPTRVCRWLGAQPGAAGATRPWIVYVPAARSPFKSKGAAASDADRVAMLAIAREGVSIRSSVWTDELDRAEPGQPSYMIQTVERAHRALGPGPTLRLLIGADQAIRFHDWRGARRLIELAEPVVMARSLEGPPGRGAAAETERLIGEMERAAFWSNDELGRWRERVADVGVIDASATGIRERIAGGAEDAELLGVLSPGVLGYIRARGLYGSRRGS
ncbi:MAG: nicotinate-nicotinamide nucleotide adenylyltransferase [Phycisphaerales bacterium]|nr:nicotinate-nicotinamide nucleotide adenylyltransferase [Phycisphaerales bacterium]